MCGFGGILSFRNQPVEVDALDRMHEATSHRGPDQEGRFLGRARKGRPTLGLSHRRLSIIDIENGQQPMTNDAGSVVVVFNGEIYNFKELRSDLIAKGHVFRTESDTEVLVHGYEDQGPGFVKRLRGMFAAAIYDETGDRLHLLRDRFGIKPLLYAIDSHRIVFGSEVATILQSGLVEDKLSEAALDVYFSTYYLPAPLTLHHSIRRLEPGQIMEVLGDGSSKTSRYWDLPSRHDGTSSSSDPSSIQSKIVDAVQSHLQSDVPVGVFLSGGIDSAAIVSAVGRSGPLTTFTAVFRESSFDESAYARQVAEHYGARHQELPIDQTDLPDALADLVVKTGEPMGDWSLVLQYCLARLARESVGVVLSGAGADEIFGGYPTVLADRLALLYRSVVPRKARESLGQLSRHLSVSERPLSKGYAIQQFLQGVSACPRQTHLAFKRIFSAQERNGLLHSDLLARSDRDPLDTLASVLPTREASDVIDQSLYLDIKSFLEGDVLRNADMSSMAHGLELRVPFLDDDLADAVCRMPASKVAYGLGGGKLLLKQAFTGTLPESIVRRKKQGFVPPATRWLRSGLSGYAREVLDPKAVASTGFLNADFVEYLLSSHISGSADHTRKLTCLISFMVWWQSRNKITYSGS